MLDITQRKLAARHREILLGELNHRVRAHDARFSGRLTASELATLRSLLEKLTA